MAGQHDCERPPRLEGRFVVEGESDYGTLPAAVLLAVGRAAKVPLSLTMRETMEDHVKWVGQWLDQNADDHTLLMPETTNCAGFHRDLRLSLRAAHADGR